MFIFQVFKYGLSSFKSCKLPELMFQDTHKISTFQNIFAQRALALLSNILYVFLKKAGTIIRSGSKLGQSYLCIQVGGKFVFHMQRGHHGWQGCCCYIPQAHAKTKPKSPLHENLSKQVETHLITSKRIVMYFMKISKIQICMCA